MEERLVEVTKDYELVKVSATFSKKVQVAQYEPIDASCSITETCKKAEAGETYDRLYEFCKNRVTAKIEEELSEKAKVAVIEADKKRIEQLPEGKKDPQLGF